MSNNNIENIVKSSLENFEVPYDASMWYSISQNLDKKSTIKDHSTNALKKWSGIILVAATGTLVIGYLSKKENKPTNRTKISVEKPELKKSVTLTTNSVKQLDKQAEKPIKSSSRLINSKNDNIITKKITLPQSAIEEANSSHQSTKGESNSTQPTQKTNLTFSTSSKEYYCFGETEELTNTNNFKIYLISPSKKSIEFEPSEKKKITFKEIGSYIWSIENNADTKNKMPAFTVRESNRNTFVLPSELDYSNGLPMLSATTSSNNVSKYKWFVNDKFVSNSRELETPIYNKGTYTISLEVENVFGCVTEYSKNYSVDESYNLLSVTGFEPNSSESKRNTFLPFALAIRNTPFRMIIIDPSNNQVIFETNDSSKPWNGINQKTNLLVPENTEYIWKVTLLNPEKGEKSEYKGRITRI